MRRTRSILAALGLVAAAVWVVVVALSRGASESGAATRAPETDSRGEEPASLAVPESPRAARDEVRAEPALEPPPAAPPSDPELTVRLVRADLGTRVDRGSVLVRARVEPGVEGAVVGRAEVDPATGTARLLLPPGSYWVLVDPESLEDGLLPPRFQEDPWDEIEPGIRRAVVELAGAGAEVEVGLWPETRVYGWVTDRKGVGAIDMAVRFTSIPNFGHVYVNHEFQTDEFGHYEGKLYPGVWRVSPHVSPEERPNQVTGEVEQQSYFSHPLLEVTRPVARVVRVPPGVDTEVSFDYGRGRGVVRGRVVDEGGAPVPGIKMFASPHLTEADMSAIGTVYEFGLGHAVTWDMTDAQGRYALRDLEPCSYRIWVDFEHYDPARDARENELSDWGGSKFLTVVDEEIVLEDFVVKVSHPFVIDGQVFIDPDWGAANTMDPSDLRLRIRMSPGPRRTKVIDRDHLRIGSDGRFTWAVETPDEPVEIWIRSWTDPEAVQTRVVEPVAEGSVELLIPFP